MARKPRPSKAQRRRRHKKQRDAHRFDAVIADTAGCFTCSTRTADDFAYQCAARREELELDMPFTRLAHEIWSPQAGRGQELALALAELAAEQQRYLEAVSRLGHHFAQLAADPAFHHEHLDPPEAHQDLVRRRIFPHLAPSAP